MIEDYFEEREVKPGFEKEYISIFNGWLGADILDKLDRVTDEEYTKFNLLLRGLFERYKIYSVNPEESTCELVDSIDTILQTHKESLEKEASVFTKLIMPELNCVFTEEWDYTYILWHKNNGAKEALQALVNKTGLYQFNDKASNK